MNYALIKRAWILQAFPPLLPLSNMVTLGMAKRMNTALYLFLQFRTVGCPFSQFSRFTRRSDLLIRFHISRRVSIKLPK
jgi:hypothetical protein